MFGSTMEYTTRNDKGEYEVARGISANVFKCILVSHLFINSLVLSMYNCFKNELNNLLESNDDHTGFYVVLKLLLLQYLH